MKYFSLLLTLLILFAGCGKKTDPVSKDSLESVKPPVLYQVVNTDSGVYIKNNEKALLYVERAKPVDGTCTPYKKLNILEPGGEYTDTTVENDQAYNYRFTKQTLKYKLVSDSVVRPVVYSRPLTVESAEVIAGENGAAIDIVPSGDFLRMDVKSGNKTAAVTGYNDVFIPSEDISGDELTIVLTDYYGNKGKPFTVSLQKKEDINETLPEPVRNLYAAYIGEALRIVWDSSENAENYEINICSEVSCETILSKVPFAVYKKDIDSCLDIAVYAVGQNGRSGESALRFCR